MMLVLKIHFAERTRAKGNDRSQDEDSMMSKTKKKAKRIFKTLIITFFCSDAGFEKSVPWERKNVEAGSVVYISNWLIMRSYLYICLIRFKLRHLSSV